MSAQNDLYTSSLMELEKDWIDYNGHLNMAYYNVLFDRGCDGFFEQLGLGPDYIKETNHSFFTAEAHTRYVRELHLGDKVQVTMQLIDHDEKRIQVFAELHHEDGWLSATSETMSLHIDMSGPKVAPFPPEMAQKVTSVAKQHASLPYPQNAGRRIEIRRK